MGCVRIFSKDVSRARKTSFVIGLIVHFLFIFCVLFGVFNRHFANGGVQLFAYAFMNMYIYMLCLLNWPITVYFREFNIEASDDDQSRHLNNNDRENLGDDFTDIR